MSFSDNNGGTLAIPSPTHAHHIDVSATVRTLRRTLSRSPSKFLINSTSSRPETPAESPSRRLRSTPHNHNYLPFSCPGTAPPVATSVDVLSQRAPPNFSPLRGTKLSLRSVKGSKTLSPRPLARARASPKSPLKRALNPAPATGNPMRVSTPSPLPLKPGQEHPTWTPQSPVPSQRSSEKSSRHSLHLDVSGSAGSPRHGLFTSLDVRPHSPIHNASGALKRSDATMNLDQPAKGTPVAKRRSMHGASSFGQGEDFNIFNFNGPTPSQSFDIHEDAHTEYELIDGHIDERQSPQSAMMGSKRASSLRKSTLQQRHGESQMSGQRGDEQLYMFNTQRHTPVLNRPRLFMEHFKQPSASKESSFSFGSSFSNTTFGPPESRIYQEPHPLSKAVTTSTSTRGIGGEHDHHISMRAPPKHPFSKSLPLNSTRPMNHPLHNHHNGIAATPSHPGQLWAGAFNSTGLISKINRNPEDDSERKLAPPDTPCKKPVNPFATFPPRSGSNKKKRPTNNRNSFAGTASTPFRPPSDAPPDTFGKPGRGLSIFQRGGAFRNGRRGSLLGADDDQKLFGDTDDFVQMNQAEAPPTPTRLTLPQSLSNVSEQSQESPSANRTTAAPMSAVRPGCAPQLSCKSDSQQFTIAGKSKPRECFPETKFHTAQDQSTSSLHTFRSARNLKNEFKANSFYVASPLSGRRTPQTPQENILPLDTSRLSISFGAHGGADVGNNNMLPPATPTTARDFRSSTSIFVTPVNMRNSNLDIDTSLYSKFDHVEQIGKGEFSLVYKGSKTELQNESRLVSTTPGQDFSNSYVKTQVYAIKKSKQPYHGPKDRDHKLREVKILRALTHAEHVLHYVDHWEHNFHLYIQTEYCEEGTLDKFLAQVGQTGRLDDFRIFKVIQDLCLGLKDVHDAGFMHLDMKPANILITFEGALKIGDFGLAQPCTMQDGADVEGDREYMAPEMLKGRVGKPADVFSLGLMTLEMAGNVVLPNNGPTWIALRSGDLSEVPSLTSNMSSDDLMDHLGDPHSSSQGRVRHHASSHDASNLFGSVKRSEHQQPPDFMVNSLHSSSLDSMVKWMTAQEPGSRPSVDQILNLEGMRWVAEHRTAATTVYEGKWGQADVFTTSVAISPEDDTEMVDV